MICKYFSLYKEFDIYFKSTFYFEKYTSRGHHMNKTHWLGVLLDGSAAEQTIRELLDISYSMTVS